MSDTPLSSDEIEDEFTKRVVKLVENLSAGDEKAATGACVLYSPGTMKHYCIQTTLENCNTLNGSYSGNGTKCPPQK